MLATMALAACGDNDGRRFPAGGYQTLSETGLYLDIEAKEVASDNRPYTVAHVLWTDGAEKKRWLYLPRGTRIDSSDMDFWELPVGAQLYKEFVRDGLRVETRLIERIDDTGDRETDYWVGAFVWNDDESEALLAAEGQDDARGTEHDVPSQTDCWRCHRGTPGNVLGLAAIQLSHDDPGVTLDTLSSDDLLTHPPTRPVRPPGDETTRAALGYLHANCGHCHNERGLASVDTDMHLQLSVDETTPEDTGIHRSTIGVPLQWWTVTQDQFDYRVVAGDPDASALAYRMAARGTGDAMPPMATEQVHQRGVDLVRAWIESL